MATAPPIPQSAFRDPHFFLMLSHPNYTILIGLFFLAFVQEDSAVVSGALLGSTGVFLYWQTLPRVSSGCG
jgi:hypothetical protein